MTEKYYIGQIFKEKYPIEAATWCNERGNCGIVKTKTEKGIDYFEIIETTKIIKEQSIASRTNNFFLDFFNIPDIGFFRKYPKGYSSAVEAMNSAFNLVSIIGNLPAGTLQFYKKPDFNVEEQCTEKWLVENSFKNKEMSASEFGQLYAKFLTTWNEKEHL